MQTSTPSIRQLSLLVLSVGAALSLLFLDSLDRYFAARYHASLEEQVSRADLEWSRSLRWFFSRREPQSNVGEERADTPARKPAATGKPDATAGDKPKEGATPAKGLPYVTPADLAPGEYYHSVAKQTIGPGPHRVLFAGDSMMQGVAPLVIKNLKSKHADWEFFDLSKESTGLTVRRYFDWPTRIIDEIEKKNLTLVVVFLGPNDPWDISEKGKRYVFPTPDWEAHYAQRVDEILSYAVAHQVKVIWVGLPPMRPAREGTGAKIQNRVFYSRALHHGTDYISVEALMGAVSLPYKKYVEKEGAEPVSVRAEDGMHFTPAGLHMIKQAVLDHLERSAR